MVCQKGRGTRQDENKNRSVPAILRDIKSAWGGGEQRSIAKPTTSGEPKPGYAPDPGRGGYPKTFLKFGGKKKGSEKKNRFKGNDLAPRKGE